MAQRIDSGVKVTDLTRLRSETTEPMSDELKIVFLGTGASVPSKRRGLPSLAVVSDGEIFLFDCGEGTQMKIREAGLSSSRIRHIFISHLHGDHVFGLPGFLTTQQMMGRTSGVTIYGPAGIKYFLDSIKFATGSTVTYPVEIIEFSEAFPKEFRVKSFRITAAALEHRGVCYGYRFDEDQKPGKFDIKTAEHLKIPNDSSRTDLQQGRSIQVGNREISPEEVLGPPRPGRSFAYCTDTRPCDNGATLALGVDALIHDSTFADDHSDWAIQTLHSTSREAALLAARQKVGRLMLWHISNRYNESQENELLKQAREHFIESYLTFDFDEITLSRFKSRSDV
jgi:ribonuclease Z